MGPGRDISKYAQSATISRTHGKSSCVKKGGRGRFGGRREEGPRMEDGGRRRLTFGSLCRKTSILFRKRMIDVRRNHRELMTDSKSASDSTIRFCVRARSKQAGHATPQSTPSSSSIIRAPRNRRTVGKWARKDIKNGRKQTHVSSAKRIR